MRGLSPHQLDLIFHALAAATRREILRRVAEKPCMVTELAGQFEMSLAAVSKHIQVLEKAGLIQRTRQGRIHRCRIDLRPLEQAAEVMAGYRKFWNERFNALEDFLKPETNSSRNGEKRK